MVLENWRDPRRSPSYIPFPRCLDFPPSTCFRWFVFSVIRSTLKSSPTHISSVFSFLSKVTARGLRNCPSLNDEVFIPVIAFLSSADPLGGNSGGSFHWVIKDFRDPSRLFPVNRICVNSLDEDGSVSRRNVAPSPSSLRYFLVYYFWTEGPGPWVSSTAFVLGVLSRA